MGEPATYGLADRIPEVKSQSFMEYSPLKIYLTHGHFILHSFAHLGSNLNLVHNFCTPLDLVRVRA
jgi:hypothetical protein